MDRAHSSGRPWRRCVARVATHSRAEVQPRSHPMSACPVRQASAAGCSSHSLMVQPGQGIRRLQCRDPGRGSHRPRDRPCDPGRTCSGLRSGRRPSGGVQHRNLRVVDWIHSAAPCSSLIRHASLCGEAGAEMASQHSAAKSMCPPVALRVVMVAMAVMSCSRPTAISRRCWISSTSACLPRMMGAGAVRTSARVPQAAIL